MSRLFGDMRQVGIVVRDIEAAMRHWVEICGIGPWFYTDRLPITAFTYGGRRYDDVHISIALANSGDVQLELIQQRCGTPSMTATSWPPGMRACSIGRAGRKTMTRFISGPWRPATRWDRRVTARGVVSSISAMKATLGRSLRWRMRRPHGCVSSTQSASPQPDGTATIRSGASGRPDLTCKPHRAGVSAELPAQASRQDRPGSHFISHPEGLR